MLWVDDFKRRWRRFKGPLHVYDIRGELESTRAEIEFKKAIERLQTTRIQFDIRTPSDPVPSDPPPSISGLDARLTIDDKLMKEAINAIEDPDSKTR